MIKKTDCIRAIGIIVSLMVFAEGSVVAQDTSQLNTTAKKASLFDEGTVVVIALHGIPAEGAGRLVLELMMLEGQLEVGYGADDPNKIKRLEELEHKLKNWPLGENNPYNVGAITLGKLLEKEIGTKVFVGFNEFCAPSLEKVFEDAVKEHPKRIMIVTTMHSAGNQHAENAESDILQSVLTAQKRYRKVEFVYAWPFDFDKSARFLHDQLMEFITSSELSSKATTLVLAMHGTPPIDLPNLIMMEFMMAKAGMGKRSNYLKLEKKIRNWPRTDKDAYWVGTRKMGEVLGKMTGSKVIVGYNEFCAPSLAETFDEAIRGKTQKVLVLSPMWEPANPHSDSDVPIAIRRAKKKFPQIEFVYAWPFSYDKTVPFLRDQLLEFKNKPGFTGS
jgi:sirohydrochlorin cobaltochelatase